jgi:ADP-heptose:LPS heptosyltransferase
VLVDGVHKIAVLRANRLGDFLLTTPALLALRAAYPAAEIVLLAREWHARLLAGRPGPVDRVVPVPPTRGVVDSGTEDPAAVESFVTAMRAERFDLAVQMHGGGRWSNPLTARLGARCTVGLRAPDAPPLDRTLAYCWYQPEVLRYLELVGLVGAEPVTLHPRLSLMDSDRAEAAALGLPDGPLVALHPGAEDPRRRWPAESFAAVGDGLAAAGATVLVTGTAAERGVVAQVVGAMTAPALSLVDSLSIGGLAAVYERCAVVVANDTGPRHLAEAVGTATVGVIWCGNLLNFGPLRRQRHRAHVAWVTACPVCGATLPEPELPAGHHGRCPHEASWMTPVDPVAVLGSATDLLRESLSGKESRPEAGALAAGPRPST